MEQGDLSRATSLTEAANHRLTEQLDKWTQEKTTVRLTAGGGDGRQMTISIGSVERQFFPPDQRSEGLRWFLGLLAFLHVSVRAEQGVVLLVDEAELHLHYDAQADLISELAQQSRVRSVIYTTHSAGCLPPDLSAVPERTRHILSSLLAKAPEDRTASARILRDALRERIQRIDDERARGSEPATRHGTKVGGSDSRLLERLERQLASESIAEGHRIVHTTARERLMVAALLEAMVALAVAGLLAAR